MSRPPYGFSASERNILDRLRTPEKIQRFIDEKIAYNKEKDGPTCLSPRLVLKERRAHCLEGALFGAAALRVQGYPPLVLDMEAVRDSDHVIALYKQRGCWGAVGTSNYSGLRFREPVYRSLRELVMSYFEHYFNPAGEKTLRTYSRPVNLSRFDSINWMSTDEEVWTIPEYLCTIPHTRLISAGQARRLNRMDERLLAAGYVGTV